MIIVLSLCHQTSNLCSFDSSLDVYFSRLWDDCRWRAAVSQCSRSPFSVWRTEVTEWSTFYILHFHGRFHIRWNCTPFCCCCHRPTCKWLIRRGCTSDVDLRYEWKSGSHTCTNLTMIEMYKRELNVNLTKTLHMHISTFEGDMLVNSFCYLIYMCPYGLKVNHIIWIVDLE